MGGALLALVRIAGILLFAMTAAQAFADEPDRVALVIGNSDYRAVAPLRNPRNDAEDIAASLERLDFHVTRAFDLGARETNLSLRDFSRLASSADMALIYYAGHGIEIDNTNYLIPVDARLERASDVPFEATELDKLLQAVQGAETLRLVLLDACRNNPFLTQMAEARNRSLGQGLARIEPTGGVLVAYAAKGGTIAYDGEGRNSPYAAALLRHLEEPGVEIGQFFRRVRDSVYRETGGLQEPFTYGSLPAKDIFLAAAPAQTTRLDVLQAFASADIRNTVEGWEEFIEGFADTPVAEDVLPRAREKLAALRRPPSQRPSPEASQAPPPPVVQSLDTSPLIRACDRLAADPEDEMLPEGIVPVPDDALDAQAARNACLLATSGHPSHQRSSYQLARAVMALGETSSGMSLMEELARGGYQAAQIALAEELMYLGQTGVVDRERAMGLLEEAVAGGSGIAARLLGDYHARVFGGVNKALEYFEIAASRGDPIAKFEIGYRLVSSTIASDEDRDRGNRLLTEAGEAGVMDAQVRLANYYLGDGPERAVEEGIRWLTRASESGDLNATARLIRIYSDGLFDLPPSPEKAAPLIERAAEAGSSYQQARAGYINEIGWGVPTNRAKAARYYFDALENGSMQVIRRATSDWDPETARALQRLLRSSPKARYTGVIDGVVGGGTRAAMRRLCECNPRSAPIRFEDLL